MSIKNLVIFLIVIVILDSCSETNESSLVSEITESIDSLKQIYAPDTRIALWDVSIKNSNNKLSVVAEVGNKNAQAGLLKLKTKFPSINFSVNLLPNVHAKTIFALVNNSVSSIRREDRHSAEMVNQTLLGTPVKVFKKEGSWYLIQTPNQYLGWINDADIVLLDSAGWNEYKMEKKIVYNRQYGFSYTKPDNKSQVVSDLVIGSILPVIDNKNNFYKVKYPDGRIAFVKKNEVIDLNTLFNKEPEEAELVKTAMKFIGIPYLWGGFSSKAIDCSGFTSAIYFLNGIILQRDASQQTKYGKEITTDFISTKLQPGDLLFFGQKAKGSAKEKVTHVAMYIGNDEFIHASGEVRISSMDSTKSNYASKYASRFVRAVRIIGQENGETIQKISDNPFYKLF
ncbi:MAG: peptidase [bacterium]|nr:MAG: peptidase [bacterium]